MWEQFFSNVVPRVRDVNIFGNLGRTARLQLRRKSAELMITLYHSILVWTKEGICETICKLIRDNIVETPRDNLLDGSAIFKTFCEMVSEKNHKYFVTTRVHFRFVKRRIVDFVFDNTGTPWSFLRRLFDDGDD